MSAVASRQDLNAYFDRVMTPNQLIEKNFGERLHLKSAYEKYRLPEGVDPKGVRVAKDHTDNKWKVYVDMGDKGKTARHEISFDDGYSLFKTRTADCGQVPHPGNQRAALGPDQQAGEIKLNENIRRIIFESEPTSINIKRTGICQQQ